jgi:hypothetical protein
LYATLLAAEFIQPKPAEAAPAEDELDEPRVDLQVQADKAATADAGAAEGADAAKENAIITLAADSRVDLDQQRQLQALQQQLLRIPDLMDKLMASQRAARNEKRLRLLLEERCLKLRTEMKRAKLGSETSPSPASSGPPSPTRRTPLDPDEASRIVELHGRERASLRKVWSRTLQRSMHRALRELDAEMATDDDDEDTRRSSSLSPQELEFRRLELARMQQVRAEIEQLDAQSDDEKSAFVIAKLDLATSADTADTSPSASDPSPLLRASSGRNNSGGYTAQASAAGAAAASAGAVPQQLDRTPSGRHAQALALLDRTPSGRAAAAAAGTTAAAAAANPGASASTLSPSSSSSSIASAMISAAGAAVALAVPIPEPSSSADSDRAALVARPSRRALPSAPAETAKVLSSRSRAPDARVVVVQQMTTQHRDLLARMRVCASLFPQALTAMSISAQVGSTTDPAALVFQLLQSVITFEERVLQGLEQLLENYPARALNLEHVRDLFERLVPTM